MRTRLPDSSTSSKTSANVGPQVGVALPGRQPRRGAIAARLLPTTPARRRRRGSPVWSGRAPGWWYLSEVERGLKRPSTDVLARLATAPDTPPRHLPRCAEEVWAKARGLSRKRALEAPMHEHAGGPPEAPAMLDATIASP